MDSFSEVICRWQTIESFAADVGVAAGTARQWKNRNRIPDAYWLDVVSAAARRNFFDVTLDLLACLASRSKRSASMDSAHGLNVPEVA